MNSYRKYILFGIIVLVSVVADQATKMWAEARLANPAEHPRLIDGPKSFDIKATAEDKGKTVYDLLKADLTGTDESDVRKIAGTWLKIDGVRVRDPELVLNGTETITVRMRKVTVVENFFHFSYTRNPGAAFGFLAKQDSSLRRPFFIIVSILAIFIILWIFRKVEDDQRLLIWSLSLIVGGAIGNFIDRIAYGWVIDFIDWHYYREFTWPTFNIADSAISIGVGLMALEIILGMIYGEPEREGATTEGGAAGEEKSES